MPEKLIKFILLLLIITVLCGCSRQSTTGTSAAKGKLEAGLVFDIGGRGDKSFNDQAYAGLEKAGKEFCKNVEYLEPAEAADRESALRQMAAKKKDIIIGVGFIFSEDVNRVAKDFPETKFACVDYVPPANEADIPANVVGLKFKEEEGAFLVGAVAALVTKTNKIGFVGGMQSPLIRKFEAGYKAGAQFANPKCEVIANYAGMTPEAFKNPAKGKELALSMYDKGADIVFHASGSTGLGVFEAARDKKKLAIGVDADQYDEAPGYILTSLIKKVDVAVYEEVKAVNEAKFKNGIRVFDLASGGIDYVYNDKNKNLISEDVHKKIEDIRQKIIKGEIKVPSTL
jgi:basic membrane protein A